MAQSVLGNVLEFFVRIGIYDVVLPFILVFTIVFAILEKTKVLGTEEIDGKKHTKRNLNAMAAFTIGFLVIASSRLVETITQVSSQVVILLLLGVFFLMLIGSFYKEGEIGTEGVTGWVRNVFIVIMLVGIISIFLNAIKTKSGQSWLEFALNYLQANWTSTGVASIILIILVILFVVYVTREGKPKGEKEEK